MVTIPSDAQDVSDFVSRYDRAIIRWAGRVLAVITMATGIMMAYELLEPNIIHYVGSAIMVVCAVLMLLDGRDVARIVGLTAVALGSYRALSYVTSIEPGSIFTFLSICLMILGLNLVYSGLHYISGVGRGRLRLIYTTSALLLVEVGFLTVSVQMGYPVRDMLQDMPGSLLMVCMYILYIALLDSNPVRSLDPREIHSARLDSMGCVYANDGSLTVTRDDAAALLGGPGTSDRWVPIADGGPAECQLVFRMSGEKFSPYAIVQRWKGSETMHLTLTDHVSGTLLHAYRFSADRVWESDGRLNLMGPQGCHTFVIEEGVHTDG